MYLSTFHKNFILLLQLIILSIMPLRLTPAVITAIFLAVDTPIPLLLFHRQLRMHRLATLLAGPTRVVKNHTRKRRIAYDPTNKWTIDQHDDTLCLEFLLFTKSQVKEMVFILRIPSKFRYGICYTAYDALALVLYHLSSPLHLKDVVDHFNRGLQWISTVFNDVCVHLDQNFHKKLEWDCVFLRQQRLQRYCNYVHANGEPSGVLWGFIDGTHREICRPQPETFDQTLLWSGYKNAHTMVFQSIVTPDGLLVHVKGPYEGRASDWGIYKDSGLQDKLKEYAKDENGQQLWVYRDAGYGMSEGIMSSYRARGMGGNRAAAPLQEDQEVFNANMAKQHIVMEWGFGKVVNTFAFIDFHKKLKLGLSPVGSLVFTAILLTNVHTCYHGSETAAYFECLPPTVWEYFGVERDDF